MPSVSIYRPPAARKLKKNTSLENMQGREMVNGSSPKKNYKCSEDAKELIQGGSRRSESNGVSVFRKAITSIHTQNKVPKCKNVESTNKKNESVISISKSEEVVKNTVQNKQRRPDIQVYVPKGRRSVTGSDNVSNVSNVNNVNNGTKSSLPSICEERSEKNSEPEIVMGEEVTCRCEYLEESTSTKANNISDAVVENVEPAKGFDCKILEPEVTPNGAEVESASVSGCKAPSEAISKGTEAKSPPASDTKCVNSNRVNVVWDSVSENNVASASCNPLRNSCEKIGEDKNFEKGREDGHLEPEELGDWETMFDDSGECLDPSLLEQLTSAVGQVTIEKPKSTYDDFKTKSLDMEADEFPHVIEIYNFPPEFQLRDLITVFSRFRNSGFEIRWVDDTHALGIFSSAAIVSEVLAFYHPFVKTRSLKEGSAVSKMKARRSAEFLQPYKPRPDTCPALARRLVTGALGVRLRTSREEREAEKKILTQAREKKRLEAKQKEDAWEGTFN